MYDHRATPAPSLARLRQQLSTASAAPNGRGVSLLRYPWWIRIAWPSAAALKAAEVLSLREFESHIHRPVSR
jgi:hypothetical protein